MTSPEPAEAVRAGDRACGPGDPPVGGRRNGRASWMRSRIMLAAAHGEHVHWAAKDGTWCVTMQPVGLLWARTEPPREAKPADAVRSLVSGFAASRAHRVPSEPMLEWGTDG